MRALHAGSILSGIVQRVSLDLGRLIAAGAVSKAEVKPPSSWRSRRASRSLAPSSTAPPSASAPSREELDRHGGLALRQVVGARDLVARLPRAMAAASAPSRSASIPASAPSTSAAADPPDRHIADEFSFHLGRRCASSARRSRRSRRPSAPSISTSGSRCPPAHGARPRRFRTARPSRPSRRRRRPRCPSR